MEVIVTTTITLAGQTITITCSMFSVAFIIIILIQMGILTISMLINLFTIASVLQFLLRQVAQYSKTVSLALSLAARLCKTLHQLTVCSTTIITTTTATFNRHHPLTSYSQPRIITTTANFKFSSQRESLQIPITTLSNSATLPNNLNSWIPLHHLHFPLIL